MDAEDARSIGHRLRQIRHARRKSQAVVAGLAGISTGHLSRIESGERALDRQSLIVTLADALEVAPSELKRLPTPAPGNGHTDSAIEGVRHALDAVDVGRPGGLVLPPDVLRHRVARVQEARRRCRFAEVADDLPGLIRDVHTSIDAGATLADCSP